MRRRKRPRWKTVLLILAALLAVRLMLALWEVSTWAGIIATGVVAWIVLLFWGAAWAEKRRRWRSAMMALLGIVATALTLGAFIFPPAWFAAFFTWAAFGGVKASKPSRTSRAEKQRREEEWQSTKARRHAELDADHEGGD
jgi:hypothetical protein